MKNRKNVKAYLDCLNSLFADGRIGLFEIIKVMAKLTLLARNLKKEERDYVLEEIEKIN